MGQISEEHQPWYDLGWREAQRDVERLREMLNAKERKILDLDAKLIRSLWWGKNLAIMLRRIVRTGLNEKRKSQAGDLVQKFGAEMGEEFTHGILRKDEGVKVEEVTE